MTILRPSDQPVSSEAPLARKPFCWHQREALDAAIARSEEAIRHSRLGGISGVGNGSAAAGQGC